MKDNKEYKEISIVDEMNQEAEEILKRIEANEAYKDIDVTPEMDARMEARLQEIDERTARKNAAKRKVHKFPRKRKIWIALVAVIVLLLALGTTSVGSKSYLKKMWDQAVGNQNMEITCVADLESTELKEDDEMVAYKEIQEKLGFEPVKLRMLPEKMMFESYEVDKERGLGRVFYVYKEKIVSYTIYSKNNDSSLGRKSEDELTDTFQVKTNVQIIDVESYKIQGVEEKRYVANFEYKGVHYQLLGIMDQTDFENILKNLKYF